MKPDFDSALNAHFAAIANRDIEAFKARFDTTLDLAVTVEETEHFLVNRELRSIELTTDDMAFVNGNASNALPSKATAGI